MKYKTKIFLGTQNDKADDQMNQWLEENQNISIIDFRYQQNRYFDHSICIFYSINEGWHDD